MAKWAKEQDRALTKRIDESTTLITTGKRATLKFGLYMANRQARRANPPPKGA